MGLEKVIILGAGPSGAYLSRLLVDAGFNVEVFDVLEKLGLKPCGWGLPYTIEHVINLPEDVILSKIKEYRVVVDESNEIYFKTRKTMGYIIDKPRFLSYLLEGVETNFGKVPSKEYMKGKMVVDARGHVFYSGRKINALQVVVRGNWNEDAVEAYYFSELIGYGWLFPLSSREAKVGVGGEADWHILERYLLRILKMLKVKEIVRREGSPIANGGLIYPSHGYKIGEALGAVMPLTGEGIRPSLLTAKALYDTVVNGRRFIDTLEATGLPFQIKVHMAVLSLLRKSAPEHRRKLWEITPPEFLVKIVSGEISVRDLASLAFKHPRFMRELLKIGIMVR